MDTCLSKLWELVTDREAWLAVIHGVTVSDFILRGSKSLQMVTAAMKLKDAYSLEGKL